MIFPEIDIDLVQADPQPVAVRLSVYDLPEGDKPDTVIAPVEPTLEAVARGEDPELRAALALLHGAKPAAVRGP